MADTASIASIPASPAPRLMPLLLRLVLVTAGVLMAIFAGTFVVGFIIGFARTFLQNSDHPTAQALARGTFAGAPLGFWIVVAAMLSAQIYMLIAHTTLRRRDGTPGIAALLRRPIRRPLVIALLVAVAVLIVIGLGRLIAIGAPAQLIAQLKAPPIVIVLSVPLVAITAPLMEEVLFRGWMSERLSPFLGGWMAALIPTVLWLGAHALDGVAKVVLLIPLAVLLMIARAVGGSAGASLMVHGAYNATSAGLAWITQALGWLPT